MTSRSVDVQLDAWRDPVASGRIKVERWLWCEPVRDQFIVRPRSIRLVWNYLRRVGMVAVWRKIRSRLAEDRRNTKVFGVGVGHLVEAPTGADVGVGEIVAFFAPNHSQNWTYLSIDMRLIVALPVGASDDRADHPVPDALRELAGWSPHSGRAIDAAAIRTLLARAASSCHETGVAPPPRPLGHGDDRAVCERLESTVTANGPSAVLFGFGNYAKTQVVPHLRRHLRLAAIHELDPDQLRGAAGMQATLDSSPWPRPGEQYDAWFIAGYHHTHAALAIDAIRSGAFAVVEKPLVTTRRQLAELEVALLETGADRLFGCFHKRYSRLNDWARRDLGVRPGEPIDMHAIVYEIPLPALHWYNWPNSGSRLVSNGCHWLDYFLFMNDYSPVRACGVQPLRRSDLVAWVTLENDAELVLSLTDTGSERLGVRDVIELRARDVTVRLIDASHYHAESSTRVVRRQRVNPMDAYGRMYDTICRRIVAGEGGDSVASLRSTRLMLDLEDLLQARHPATGSRAVDPDSSGTALRNGHS